MSVSDLQLRAAVLSAMRRVPKWQVILIRAVGARPQASSGPLSPPFPPTTMLSTTFTAHRSVSSARILSKCWIKANSTAAAPKPGSEAVLPTTPKRSIPAASAFADLLHGECSSSSR